MTVYIKETGEAKTITLKAWDGDNYSCDFFAELETDLIDGSEISEAEYAKVVDYWASEVNDHNDGKNTEQFGEYSDYAFELMFDHD